MSESIFSYEPIILTKEVLIGDYFSQNCQLIIKMWELHYPKSGFHPPWIGYFVKRNEIIVGSCGFVAPPQNKKVEISYGTFKEYEGRGISSESCRYLVSLARKEFPEIIITAKTAPENNSSTKILLKNNFIFSRIVQDDEIGDAWEWVLPNK